MHTHTTHTCTHTEMHQYSRPCWIPPPSNHFLMPAFTVHMSLPNNKTKLHRVQHNLQAVLAAFRAPPLPLPLGKHDRSQTSTPTCCLLIWKAIYDFSLFCRVLTAVGRKSREGDFCFHLPMNALVNFRQPGWRGYVKRRKLLEKLVTSDDI